jgi:predicted amidophosphoribosyltransferase
MAQNWISSGGKSANFLKRTRATPYLSDLYTEERFRVTDQLFNVTKSAVEELTRISTVVLVDDILTTGATAISAARALKLAGAKTIYLATMARTLEAES